MSRRSANLRNYAFALITLSILAGLYHAATLRLLHVAPVQAIQPRPPTQSDSIRANLEDVFPADAWQLGDCKRLLAGSGTMLFRELHQISESQWKLKPLTLVIGRGLSDKGRSQAPIILTAPEGAEIQFAESLDLTLGSAPPIKVGRMIGDVSIRQAGQIAANDALNVQTRNVWIDNQKVWTTERISMRVRGANLVGRDLTIHLAASATSAAKAERPSTLLDRMELIYLEQCLIPLDTPQTSKPTEPRGTISIGCRNGMKYDFALDRLSLSDNVRMTRSVGVNVVDQFTCDAINIVLRNPEDRTIDRAGPLDWFKRVHAMGTPARVQLGEHQFSLDAETIDFDAEAGLLRALGSRGVQLRRGGIETQLQSLVYQYDPANSEQLGVVDVSGAGTLVCNDDSVILRHLKWDRSFRFEPLNPTLIKELGQPGAGGKLFARIEGGVEARLRDGGIASAETVEGTLRSFNASGESTWMPEVVHAIGAVSVKATQVMADTEQLSLYFEPVVVRPKPRRLLAPSSQPAPSNTVSQPGQATESGALASWSVGGQPSEPANGMHAPVARPRPRIEGDVVSAKMLITPDGFQTKDVSLQGNVQVQHHVQLGQEWLPIEIVGENMRAVFNSVMQGSGKDYLQIGSGPDNPARLKMGDGYFVGPMIKVWPKDNLIQVEGAGRLRVPPALLARNANQELKGAPAENGPTEPSRNERIEWTHPPECEWGEAMQFDGRVAVLGGGVQVDAGWISADEPWNARLVGDQMQIALSKGVTLMERDSFAEVEIDQIRVLESNTQPVTVRAEQLDASQERQSIHLIHSHQLDFYPKDGGQLTATGPGWYRAWMRSDKNQSLVNSRRQPRQALPDEVLQGVHLTFRERMFADLGSEQLVFSGGVRTGIREVASWDDQVNVSEMERLALGEMTMDCGELQFGMTPGMPSHLRNLPGMPLPWEMVATNSVVARINTEKQGLIETAGDRATYQSQKNLFFLEGEQNHGILIRQTYTDGRAGNQMRLDNLKVNLKTYEIDSVVREATIRPAERTSQPRSRSGFR
ncbi:MAG: hypothetical protein AAFV88_03595 [Planctomycetota bacterium]